MTTKAERIEAAEKALIEAGVYGTMATANDLAQAVDAVYSAKTLRDEFAMAALVVISSTLDRDTKDHIYNVASSNAETTHDVMARAAYKVASAMMKERNRNER